MNSVWVLYIDEGHNEKVKVFTNEALATTWLHNYVVENWWEVNTEEDPPADRDEAIQEYFQSCEQGSYYLGECPVVRSQR